MPRTTKRNQREPVDGNLVELASLIDDEAVGVRFVPNPNDSIEGAEDDCAAPLDEGQAPPHAPLNNHHYEADHV